MELQVGAGQYGQIPDCDTPRYYCNIDNSMPNGPVWVGQHLQDTEVVYDNGLQKARGNLNGRQNVRQGRRSKGYRRLWEQVKSVGRGDALDADGRALNMCEWSVEELVRLVSKLSPEASAVSAIAPALHYLDSRAMAALMKELAKVRQLQRAMELFNWLKSLEPGHELYALCDVYTFTTAISLMGQAQQLRTALELVAEMRSRGHICNVHTYSALMNVCIKCDACDLALDVFKQMKEEGTKPNVVTYNTLVDVYGKTGQWEKAVQVLDDMQLEGLEPEVRTFNTAIIACNMCGQPQEALKVYQKLLDANLTPIGTTYTALISAYGKAGKLECALETFQEMVRQGCERSVITYSALISACEKAGRWEFAMQLFDQMQQEGCTPNTVTYNALIMACSQVAMWEKAEDIFEQMKFKGCRPDVVTYTALIGAYERAGEWQRAAKFFDHMLQLGCKPDSYVYQTIIDMLWQTGVTWAQARSVQLFAIACRNWQYRFLVQSTSPDVETVEFIVPASTASVAVLSTHKWLLDLRTQLHKGVTVLFPSKKRFVLSVGRGRHSRDVCNAIKTSLCALLDSLGAPFTAQDVILSTNGVLTLEAPVAIVQQWLQSPELPQKMANLHLPANMSISDKRMSYCTGPPELAAEGTLEAQCIEAFKTVKGFEASHTFDAACLSSEYLASRAQAVEAAFSLAQSLQLGEEVAFDAVLLMDRVVSTGLTAEEGFMDMLVAACLRVAAIQMEGNEPVPTEAALAALGNFPPGALGKMESNIRAALTGDMTCISGLRCLKLYLERLGYSPKASPAMLQPLAYMKKWLQEVLLLPGLLGVRPSVIAAAVLGVARRYLCCLPAWPSSLVKMTGFSGLDDPEVAAAVSQIEPLISRSASCVWASAAATASDAVGALRLMQQGGVGLGNDLLGSAALMGTTFTGSLVDPAPAAVSSALGSMKMAQGMGYGVSSSAAWADLPNVSLPALHVPPRQPLSVQQQQQQLGGMHAGLLRAIRQQGSLSHTSTPRSDYSPLSTPHHAHGVGANELLSLFGNMGPLQSSSPNPASTRPSSSSSLHQLSGMAMNGDPNTPHAGMMLNSLAGRGVMGGDIFTAAAAAASMPLDGPAQGLAGSPRNGTLPLSSQDQLLMTMRNLSLSGSPMGDAFSSPRFGFHQSQQELGAPSRLAHVTHAYGAGHGGVGQPYLLPGAQDVAVMDQWSR